MKSHIKVTQEIKAENMELMALFIIMYQAICVIMPALRLFPLL